MNKFAGPEDHDYEVVAGKIEEFLQNIRKKEADDWIRDKCYTAKRLEIERLSHGRLPMDRCYINLAIVEQPGQVTHATKEGDALASPFSLLARQKVQTPDKLMQVELATVFNERTGRDGQVIRPRRILIRGRAGVGKTTLCKKIIYEFYRGTWVEWTKMFDRILWVPLRNLKLPERRHVPVYNLEDLFSHEYFSLASNRAGLARELSTALATKRNKTLFLLDGLDEVSQDLVGEDSISRFLKVLLEQPNVIITSRPSAKAPPDLHLELETVGFYPNQVSAYLQMVFDDSKEVKEVQSFLDAHWLIQSLVRIPIQLDALCYTWGSFSGTSIPQTMTAIYQKIAESLWKKDAVHLEKEIEGKLLMPPHLENAEMESDEMNDIIGKELRFLEGIAFTGMYNDAIDFDSKSLNAISKQFKLPGETIFLDKTLPHLSFLRASDPSSRSSNPGYHFLHLTFQEYFAARYFLRRWMERRALKCLNLGPRKEAIEIEPVQFLYKHKYNARYDIFWRFVSGLINTEGETETLRFFQAIEAEPRDLLGPTHERLVMHCLSEVIPPQGESSFSPFRSVLEGKLADWLLFECRFRSEPPWFGREREFPEEALKKAIAQASAEERSLIWQSLESRPLVSPSLIDLASSFLSHSVSRPFDVALLNFLAVKSLQSQKPLSEKTVKAVVRRLQDEDSDIRLAAVKALQSQWPLSEEIMEIMVTRLEDEDGAIQQAVFEALQGQRQLSKKTVKVIIKYLEHEKWRVRWAAVEILQSQEPLTKEIVEAIARQLEDKDWRVQQAAGEALQSRGLLSKTVETAEQLEDKDKDVQRTAVKALQSQGPPSKDILHTVAGQLEHEDWQVRRAAIRTLQSQGPLSEKAVKAVARRMEDTDSSVRWAAVITLQSQGPLSKEIVKGIARLLEIEDLHVQLEALKALQSQTPLSKKVVKAVAKRLEDTNWRIRWAAVEVFRQGPLPKEITKAVVRRLEDDSGNTRWAAVRALESQSQMSRKTVKEVAKRLKNQDWTIRMGAVEVLQRQRSLSEETVKALAGQLENVDWRIRWAAFQALHNQGRLTLTILDQHMESLYWTLLERSLRENVVWYIADGIPYISVDTQETPLDGQIDQLMNALWRVQNKHRDP